MPAAAMPDKRGLDGHCHTEGCPAISTKRGPASRGVFLYAQCCDAVTMAEMDGGEAVEGDV